MKKIFKWKKLSNKKMRIVLGMTMMYAFLNFVYLFFISVQVAIASNLVVVFNYMLFLFFSPCALIWLCYFMLTKIYPHEEGVDKK